MYTRPQSLWNTSVGRLRVHPPQSTKRAIDVRLRNANLLRGDSKVGDAPILGRGPTPIPEIADESGVKTRERMGSRIGFPRFPSDRARDSILDRDKPA